MWVVTKLPRFNPYRNPKGKKNRSNFDFFRSLLAEQPPAGGWSTCGARRFTTLAVEICNKKNCPNFDFFHSRLAEQPPAGWRSPCGSRRITSLSVEIRNKNMDQNGQGKMRRVENQGQERVPEAT
uniref:Uncharacterized protein n=1 Tax=Cacopsylla melanoneura TaxID=428564 RepID=A0A8D8TGG0_9HEMI